MKRKTGKIFFHISDCAMLMSVLMLFLVVLSLASCQDSVTTADAKILKIDLDAAEKVINLTEIADSTIFVPLETTDKSRFGSVDKLMVDEGRFIVVDKELSASIYVFDANGRFVNKIGQKGKAKNEYIELTDAAMGNGSIYVYDARGKKVVRYSMDGKSQDTYPFEYTATSFRHVEGDLFAFYCSYSGNSSLSEDGNAPNLIFYDFGTKGLRKDLMFKETCSYEAMPIEVNNLNPYLYGSLSDEVYDINKRGKQTVVKLDYGDSYAKEQSAFVKKACAGLCDMKELEKKMGEGTLPMLVNFMDSGNAYFVFCVKKGKLFYEFLSKRTGKVVSAVRAGGIPVKDNLYDGIVLMPKAAADGYIYTDIEPSAVNPKMNVKVDEDGNPVIVKIKLKDF